MDLKSGTSLDVLLQLFATSYIHNVVGFAETHRALWQAQKRRAGAAAVCQAQRKHWVRYSVILCFVLGLEVLMASVKGRRRTHPDKVLEREILSFIDLTNGSADLVGKSSTRMIFASSGVAARGMPSLSSVPFFHTLSRRGMISGRDKLLVFPVDGEFLGHPSYGCTFHKHIGVSLGSVIVFRKVYGHSWADIRQKNCYRTCTATARTTRSLVRYGANPRSSLMSPLDLLGICSVETL